MTTQMIDILELQKRIEQLEKENKQMSQQIASYRELIFKEGKHNVNS